MANNRSKLDSPKHRQNQTKPRDQDPFPAALDQPPPRGQKRSPEAQHSPTDVAIEPSVKRLRASAGFAAARPIHRVTQPSEARTPPLDPIHYWLDEQAWPKEYFEPDTMNHLLAKPTPSRRKRSVSSPGVSSVAPSDQKTREEKSAPYKNPRYESLLETKGSFMDGYKGENESGIATKSESFCRTLLQTEKPLPKETRFDDNLFPYTCGKLRSRNEARVVRDISELIVSSAEYLATRGLEDGAKHLQRLTESVNEGWNNSVPLTGTRPQPDYSVGFKREAFTEEQLEKLEPFIGDFIAGDQSFFMATYYMYFPFLTCEVKCGSVALDIADRQNAHSMTLAVRAVAELFKLADRKMEIHREILAFSVSHDDTSVRIYGHYPVIDGERIKYYRHKIDTFNFTGSGGREKWTAYKFTRNVYDEWMPKHFERLCSVIDALPKEWDFDVALPPQDTELSRRLESHHLSQSAASQTGDDESHNRDTTLNTSLTQ